MVHFSLLAESTYIWLLQPTETKNKKKEKDKYKMNKRTIKSKRKRGQERKSYKVPNKWRKEIMVRRGENYAAKTSRKEMQ